MLVLLFFAVVAVVIVGGGDGALVVITPIFRDKPSDFVLLIIGSGYYVLM